MSAPSAITVPGLTLGFWTACKLCLVCAAEINTIGEIQTAINTGATVDGVVTVLADRVLVICGSDETLSGIYTVANSASARATDADLSAEFTHGKRVAITHGTVNAGRTYKYLGESEPTLTSDDLPFQAGPAAIPVP